MREELAEILDRGSEFCEDFMVTITRVSVSADLQYAAVYISIPNEEPERALQNLSKNVYNIQQILNRRLRMRPVPKIHFVIDEEEMRRERVEKSLAELKRKEEA